MSFSVLEIMVTIGAFLSTLGCISIAISYWLFAELRNLFFRITLYHSIVQTVQAFFLEMSMVYSEQTFCRYFAVLRIMGASSSIIFSIIQLHQLNSVLSAYKMQSLRQTSVVISQYRSFLKEEIIYLIAGFAVPLIISQFPLWMNLIVLGGDFCYMNTDDKGGEQLTAKILVSILSWELLIMIYIVYAIVTWFSVRQVYDDYQTYDQVRELKKTFYINVLITLWATIPYTISDILNMAETKVPDWFLGVSLFLLATWGFMDSMNIWLNNSNMQYQFKLKLGLIEEDLLDDGKAGSGLEMEGQLALNKKGSMLSIDDDDDERDRIDFNKMVHNQL